MTTTVFCIVLLAALIHAGWNAAIKASGDKAHAMLGMVAGHAPFAALALLFVPWPALASWTYVVGGALLHVGYQLFLMRSYRDGDLTHVYPIARGSAPLITALLSAWLIGEHLGGFAWAGIAAIAIGLSSLVAVRRGDGLWDARTAGFALLTGCFTAGYSITDGLGARVAGSAVGFYAVLSLLNTAIMVVLMEWRRPGLMAQVVRQGPLGSLAAGGASFTAFSMVVWAFTQAPIALVSALRETSVVFALLLGVVVLKERLNLIKVAATATTMAGALLVKMAR